MTDLTRADPRLKGPLANPDQGAGYGSGEVAPETYEPAHLEHERFGSPLNPITDLMQLRAQFPFLPVMPFPTEVRSVVLAANVAQDIKTPSGATVAMFFGSTDFYLNRAGRAEVPLAANIATNFSIYKPDRFLFYMRGVQSVSVVSATADCVVSGLFYTTRDWPSFTEAMQQKFGG